MASQQLRPVRSGFFLRAIRFAIPGPLRRRWLRLRWLAGPLPQNWWPEFEHEFRAYCATGRGPSRHPETDL